MCIAAAIRKTFPSLNKKTILYRVNNFHKINIHLTDLKSNGDCLRDLPKTPEILFSITVKSSFVIGKGNLNNQERNIKIGLLT